MLHYIFLEYLLHTNPHKNVYISKQNNAINIISSDSESTINFTLENHVCGKTHILSFFLILKGLCPLIRDPRDQENNSKTPTFEKSESNCNNKMKTQDRSTRARRYICDYIRNHTGTHRHGYTRVNKEHTRRRTRTEIH